MEKLFKFRTINKQLAILALLLAIMASIAGNPINKNVYPDWKIKETTVNDMELKVISVNELAKWIMEKRNNYLLMDTRSQDKFDEYHIPSAQNFNGINISEYPSTIIVYTQDELIPNNVRILISDNDAKEIILLWGGMNEWINKILFPNLNYFIYKDKDLFERIITTSRYFGGNPILPKHMESTRSQKYLREGC